MSTVSRLIRTFVPEHYQLSLELNRVGRRFQGTVSIHGTLQPDTSTILLHAKDLEIESVLIDGKTATFTQQTDDELVISQDNLLAGTHIVVLGFSGHITDAMNGLYPCYYEHAGVKKELLATQFESHHAREVFPCIDEPEAKATFDLTLTTEESLTVLSNMPAASQDSDGRQMVTTFERSPRMSVYLLAFVVGELHAKTARTKNNVEVNVWSTPAQPVESLEFALDTAIRVTEYFEDYFGVAYPLPKCDHVALPDFAAGAMENWGLITYREAALLIKPGATSVSARQYTARIIAHEVSHQWFGNLVTMKWWNDLWLNESFATLMMYLAVQQTYPEWDSWLDFATSQPVIALDRDSIEGVQAVQVDVNHPDEINTLFDSAIVYAKGARLLRMLERYVGQQAFQQGLRQYFKQFAYGNTEGDDLWQAIGQASGKDITHLMNTWVSQPGFPVVHVSQTGDQVHLEQEQFFVGPHTPSTTLWPIPLDATSPDAPELLDGPSATFAHTTDSVLRFNQADATHFVTHYSDELFDRLLGELQAGTLPTITRIQLLNEATLLARGGVISSARLIPLLNAYQNEDSEHVWGSLSGALAELRKFVEDDAAAEQTLRQLAARIARRQYERLGWDALPGESESDTNLRSTVIALMLYSEDPTAIETAASLYHAAPLENLNPDLRPLILKSIARHGDESVVDELVEYYKNTTSAELQVDISIGVTATRIPSKLLELLDLLRDTSIIRSQDTRRWYIQLIRSQEGRALSWQWIRDNWQWILDTFGGSKDYDEFPRRTAAALTTRQQLDEYKLFFEPKQDEPSLTRAISMGVSEIEGRIALIERDKDEVRAALLEL